MPNIDNLKETKQQGFSRGPRYLDKEQLEYSAKTILTYGIIVFAVVGVATSITYMTIQQLKK